MVKIGLMLVGALGLIISLGLIGLALYLESIGAYPAEWAAGLSSYYLAFGIVALIFLATLVLGILAKEN